MGVQRGVQRLLISGRVVRDVTQVTSLAVAGGLGSFSVRRCLVDRGWACSEPVPAVLVSVDGSRLGAWI